MAQPEHGQYSRRRTSEESNPRATARTVSFGRIWPLAAPSGPGTGPRGEEMAGRSSGTDSQDLATILDPFRVIIRRFRARPPIRNLNIVILPQLRFLRLELC